MTINPKPFASLSSGLLARKGAARPAMRPQGYGSLASLSSAGDALGWNDMGDPEPVAPTRAAPVGTGPVETAPVETAPVPPVLVEREALKEGIGAAVPAEPSAPASTLPEPRSVSLATATRLRKETAQVTKKGTKAAFTLRLDADRHLRLRLASATRGRSAQQLVTQALDAFLETLTEVEALARQLPPVKR